VNSPNAASAVRYQPTPVGDFITLLDQLPLEADTFTFIDLGAGKGLTLCLAAARPFRRIVGVEFSRALVAVARLNLRRLRLRQRHCFDTEVLCLDATLFCFPREPSVVYLYNPFGEDVLAQVLSNLAASLAAAPRPLFIVYYNAVHRALPDQSPHLESWANLGRPQVSEPTAIYRARLR
jgi:16S rRNA G966 N2-methylase RsmD